MKTLMPMDPDALAPADLEAQAWAWMRLLTSGDARALDAQKFRHWVRTSAAHQAAYNEVKSRWDAIEPPARELMRIKPQAATVREHEQRGAFQSRRAFLGAAVGAAAVAGIAVVHPPLGLWPAPAEWKADYRTAAGEQSTLALADRVNVTLNTRTSARRYVASGGETLGLELIIGEAAVDMAGSGRSFAVIAGAGRAIAEAGRFEVRNLDGKVCVTCIEGAVRLEHPEGARALAPGQQAIYDAVSLSGVGRVDPADVSAWRKGLLVFNQTRLADAVHEINRYRAGRVVLMNDAARGKPVSGRFAIASLDLALWQLQQAFDLHARSLPGGLLVLS